MTWLQFIIIVFAAVQDNISAVTVLTTESYTFENQDWNMTCIYNGPYSFSKSRWSHINGGPSPTGHIELHENTCIRTGILNNSLYQCSYVNKNTFLLTFKDIQKNQHGQKWTCTVGNEESNIATVVVQVPITFVNMTNIIGNKITAVENISSDLICNTSEGRPAANITWKKNAGTVIDIENDLMAVNISTAVKNTTDDLKRVHSVITIKPLRNDSKTIIFCEATNGKDVLTSGNKTLHVQYPPDRPKIRVNNKEVTGTIKLIYGRKVSFYCLSNSDPAPTYIWHSMASKIVQMQYLNISNVQRNETFTCIVTNIMTLPNETNISGNNTASLSVHVLVSPTTPVLKFGTNGSKIENSTLFVIRNDSLIISCHSFGDPTPTFKWLDSDEDGPLLKIKSIKRNMNNTCIASNTLQEYVGEAQNRSKSTTVAVIVSYPPGTPSLQITYHSRNTRTDFLADDRLGIIEYSSFTIMCKADSYPSPTYTWNSPNNTISNSLTNLTISNITRNQAGLYTCLVQNTMKRSFQNTSQIGQSERDILLDIQYQSSVEQFCIEGEEHSLVVEVDENKTVWFQCRTDSNPVSDISLMFEGKQLNHSKNTNVLIHTRNMTSCLDAGVYVCSGKNDYNDEPSLKNLTVNIKCTPQASPFFLLKTNFTRPQNVSVTFNFTALAHPLPEFVWFKLNGSTWENQKTNRKLLINSSDLQSNFTIMNISENDYGRYKLRVLNTVGNFEQVFVLHPNGKPDPPTVFKHLSDMVTETTGTVQWIPGFNGGLNQTFILRYKPEFDKYWTNVSLQDVGEKLMNYTLTGLASASVYVLELFSVNSVGQSLTLNLAFQTKDFVVKDAGPRNVVIFVVVGCAFCGSAIVIGLGVYFYRKRNKKSPDARFVYQNIPFKAQSKQMTKRVERPALKETEFRSLQELDDVPELCSEPTEYYNTAEKIENIVRIKVSELFDYVSDKTVESFSIDFQKLPTALTKPCTFARQPENIAMNRYNGIFPYDHSRVKINDHPEFFINACYIDGYRRCKAYIASLGPTAKTTDDFIIFWKMVWHEESDIIVMLTNLNEPSGMKCEQYWPRQGVDESYGGILVSCQNIEVYAEYTIRSFNISKGEVCRSLSQLHYTAWPDKKVPEDVTSLVEFRQRFKATPTSSNGPVVVHCSAGIGRTGTFIGLDRLIDEGENEGSVNVFDCVRSMREQRVKMVQTNEQYIFIYKALVNVLAFDCGPIPIESFTEYVDTTNNNTYSRQFQHLKQSIETEGKETLLARAKNERLASKNRREADIPGDENRVHLYLNRSSDDSDYINAVYINSFKEKDHFILAQSPLPSTASDFVCMIYQENCSCLVTMEDLKEPGTEVGMYLPAENHTLNIGNFTVSCSRHDAKPQYTVRKMKIKNNVKFSNDEKVVYHFQYNEWIAGNDIPKNAENFVEFAKEVEEYSGQLGDDTSHVLVHCLKANQRSGLFCAVSILMEKMKYERQVSVLNTLRRLRTRRRSAITCMEQLKFCYQATSAYINM